MIFSMAVPFAVSFETRIRRDRLSFIIKLEFLIIIMSVLVFLFITNQHLLLKAAFSLLASVSLLIVLKDRLEKAGRRLKRAVVLAVRSRGPEWFFMFPTSHPFSFNAVGYVVEAISEDMHLIRFADWKPWKVGQKLLVLSDMSGKVLAIRDIRHPVRLELLKRLA